MLADTLGHWESKHEGRELLVENGKQRASSIQCNHGNWLVKEAERFEAEALGFDEKVVQLVKSRAWGRQDTKSCEICCSL